MLNYLRVDNYRSLVNFKIDFSSVNILLGTNGTGKSTVFELLSNMREFIQGNKNTALAFPFTSLTRWQIVPVQTFELSISYKGYSYIYQLEIEFNLELKKNRVKRECVLCDGYNIFKAENGKAVLYNDSYKEGPELLMNWASSGISTVYDRLDNKKLYNFKQAINNIIVCHPSPDLIDTFFSAESAYPSYDASNLPEVYFHEVQSQPEKLPELWDILKQINPHFVRTYLKGEDGKSLYFEYENQNIKTSYKVTEISDGERMLFILYFLTIMYLNEDFSLLLDEPDNYLSLQEVGLFAQFLQDKIALKGQCIMISHHPNVIDYFAPSDGIWFTRRSYGATTIGDAPVSDSGLTYSEIIAQGGLNEIEQKS